jgi:hypothetical protein
MGCGIIYFGCEGGSPVGCPTKVNNGYAMIDGKLYKIELREWEPSLQTQQDTIFITILSHKQATIQRNPDESQDSKTSYHTGQPDQRKCLHTEPSTRS